MKTLLTLGFTLALATPLAAAGSRVDPMCTPDALPSATDPHAYLTRVFARAEVPADVDPYSAPAGPMEVVILRLGDDGKPVLACVDDEHAARAFFEAPVARVRTAPEEK